MNISRLAVRLQCALGAASVPIILHSIVSKHVLGVLAKKKQSPARYVES